MMSVIFNYIRVKIKYLAEKITCILTSGFDSKGIQRCFFTSVIAAPRNRFSNYQGCTVLIVDGSEVHLKLVPDTEMYRCIACVTGVLETHYILPRYVA